MAMARAPSTVSSGFFGHDYGDRQSAMSDEHTTAVIERYMIGLAGDTPAEFVIRELLDRAVGRLRMLLGKPLASKLSATDAPADELAGRSFARRRCGAVAKGHA
jgi:hypothetical protein